MHVQDHGVSGETRPNMRSIPVHALGLNARFLMPSDEYHTRLQLHTTDNSTIVE